MQHEKNSHARRLKKASHKKTVAEVMQDRILSLEKHGVRVFKGRIVGSNTA